MSETPIRRRPADHRRSRRLQQFCEVLKIKLGLKGVVCSELETAPVKSTDAANDVVTSTAFFIELMASRACLPANPASAGIRVGRSLRWQKRKVADMI